MATLTYRTLEEIAQEARPYPTYLLEEAETGLCLFSAAFMGHNDVIHFSLEEVKTTCVDVDQEKLNVMASLYTSPDWKFYCHDAWDFAKTAAEEEVTWDVVNVDTFRGNATERSLKDLTMWTQLANTAVVATLADDVPYEVPEGWTDNLFQRNSEVYWLVLTRV